MRVCLCVCLLVVAGLVTSCQRLKLSSVPRASSCTVINLAGTGAKGRTRLRFSPHARTFPQAFAEKKKERKETESVVSFSSRA